MGSTCETAQRSWGNVIAVFFKCIGERRALIMQPMDYRIKLGVFMGHRSQDFEYQWD
jgi:hypothetical protein